MSKSRFPRWISRSIVVLLLPPLSLVAQSAPAPRPDTAAAGIHFSPDGRTLLYQLLPIDPRTGVAQLFVANLDGSNERPVRAVEGTGPQGGSFSPDGSRYAYLSLRGSPTGGFKAQLAVVAIDGSGGRILSDSGGWGHEWSPDGNQLLFTALHGPLREGSFGVGLVNADGSGLTTLSTGLSTIQSGAWSPDGKRMVYAVKTAAGSALMIADRTGAHPRPLVTLPREQASPIWSPDGRVIVFFGGDSAGRSFGAGQHLYAVGADGKGLHEIVANATGISGISFSPDGKRLAFADRRAGRASDIFLLDIDGRNERALVTDPGTDESPVWSPNGRQIAYQSSVDPQGQKPHVFIMNADGSDKRRIR